MEELLDRLSESLSKTVEVKEDEHHLLIELHVKKEDLVPGDLGTPREVEEMMRMFGGVSRDIEMDVTVDENARSFTMKMRNKEDFNVVRGAMKDVWKRAARLLTAAYDAVPGKGEEFKELGDFDENY